jgi:hypothetical protein
LITCVGENNYGNIYEEDMECLIRITLYVWHRREQLHISHILHVFNMHYTVNLTLDIYKKIAWLCMLKEICYSVNHINVVDTIPESSFTYFWKIATTFHVVLWVGFGFPCLAYPFPLSHNGYYLYSAKGIADELCIWAFTSTGITKHIKW